MLKVNLDEIRISRARIVQSTVYPELKSIRPRSSPAHSRGRLVRHIFDPFEIGEAVAVVAQTDLNYLMAATRTWEEERESAKSQVH